MLRFVLLAAAAFSSCLPPLARAEVEFEGRPFIIIEVSEGKTSTTPLPPEKAAEFRVVITREGSQYFWKSRKDIPLVKTESGGYITYVATTGAGYIRVLAPFMREMLSQLPREEREREFVYMEHLTITLGSVTYFGK